MALETSQASLTQGLGCLGLSVVVRVPSVLHTALFRFTLGNSILVGFGIENMATHCRIIHVPLGTRCHLCTGTDAEFSTARVEIAQPMVDLERGLVTVSRLVTNATKVLEIRDRNSSVNQH